MSARDDRFWEERVALRYLDALDDGDLDAVAALWEQAAVEPDLAALLDELNRGLEAEEGPGTDFATDAARVVELARRHLPSAFPIEGPTGPILAADVARRLEAEPEFRRLDAIDRAAHARLLADATPIPDSLGQPGIDRWLGERGVVAGPFYRKAFRKVAVLLAMARGQGEARLAAARQSAPKDGGKGGGS
jgi:hypothetical protein